MAAPRIRLLHVEDEETGRRLVAHHLAALPEFEFEIQCAEAEADAIEQFAAGGIDFVILDYHLGEGDGLSCLERIRQIDPQVPIVAISGVATPQIAAELIQAGADDYISKKELSQERLGMSVREALRRVTGVRRYLSLDEIRPSRCPGNE